VLLGLTSDMEVVKIFMQFFTHLAFSHLPTHHHCRAWLKDDLCNSLRTSHSLTSLHPHAHHCRAWLEDADKEVVKIFEDLRLSIERLVAAETDFDVFDLMA
jgi:hypothetical protein